MIGAIAGDIIGSPYERFPIKTKDFPFFDVGCRFTDDSVLTIAVASAIMTGRSYLDSIRDFGQRYPRAGYGGTFIHWLFAGNPMPYNSWGNGSAMRVSPVGFAFDSEEAVMANAKQSSEITHNHPEGIKGAQATALSIYFARTGATKAQIRSRIKELFGYDLDRTVEDIRPEYAFDVSCQGSVPEAIIAFLDGNSYEDAVRNAVSLGGDSDTLACITGGIAQAFYGDVPRDIQNRVKRILPPDLWQVVEQFLHTYIERR